LLKSSIFSTIILLLLLPLASCSDWPYIGGGVGGLIGFLILCCDIYVILRVVQSNRSPLAKIIWIIVILLFPIAGIVVYFIFAGDHQHYETIV